MIRIHNMLLAAALASAIALPCAAESLSLADLADAQDAQMIDMDAQDGAWTYPIPYDLLIISCWPTRKVYWMKPTCRRIW